MLCKALQTVTNVSEGYLFPETDFLPLDQWYRHRWLLQDNDSIYDEFIARSCRRLRNCSGVKKVSNGIRYGIELCSVMSHDFVVGVMVDEEEIAEKVVKGEQLKFA